MKVAALQLCAQDDVASNLAEAEVWIAQACEQGADLVLLPEGFAFLGAESDKIHCAESLDGSGPIMRHLRRWATQYEISVIAGGLAEKAEEGQPPFNCSVALDRSGRIVGAYRKMHLFDVDLSDGTRLKESRATTRGQEPSLVQLEETQIGMGICYDLRFPEFFSWLTQRGAQILTVPAAFTQTTGTAHWHVLLRARAIETQCFVVAAAQVGEHPKGRKTYGHSMIVDPWGTILAEVQDAQPGFALATLEMERLLEVRASMPIKAHRHPFFTSK